LERVRRLEVAMLISGITPQLRTRDIDGRRPRFSPEAGL